MDVGVESESKSAKVNVEVGERTNLGRKAWKVWVHGRRRYVKTLRKNGLYVMFVDMEHVLEFDRTTLVTVCSMRIVVDAIWAQIEPSSAKSFCFAPVGSTKNMPYHTHTCAYCFLFKIVGLPEFLDCVLRVWYLRY